MNKFLVRVPATTANLGPGFDCMGLALDLWNETAFSSSKNRNRVIVSGEGEGQLPTDNTNLVVRSMLQVYKYAGIRQKPQFNISCQNNIPLRSGLGSSSAAALAGILGGNALLGFPLSTEELLSIGNEIEGHLDNITPALLGGLTIVTQTKERIITQKIQIPQLTVVVVFPEIDFPTNSARHILPEQASYTDIVFNLGRVPLVVEALRSGDFNLLINVMQDRLHQPYRLPLIPGAEQALKTAFSLGAPAALSGAGPSLVAFAKTIEAEKIAGVLQTEFENAGVNSRRYLLSVSSEGAEIIKND